MTIDELKNKRAPYVTYITQMLNEKYDLFLKYPLSYEREYNNLLYFAKGFGCKVLRNSKGMHKLIENPSFLEKEVEKANKK